MKIKTTFTLAFASALPLAVAAEQDPSQDGKTPPEKTKPRDDVDPDKVASVWEYLSGRYDTNGDGKIDEEEYPRGAERFKRLDKDGNGFIEKADTAQSGGRGARGGQRGQRGQRGRGDRGRVEAPSEGAVAPDFKLETLYPKEVVVKSKGDAKTGDTKKDESKQKPVEKKPVYDVLQLSSFKDKKPVALIFGSYT